MRRHTDIRGAWRAARLAALLLAGAAVPPRAGAAGPCRETFVHDGAGRLRAVVCELPGTNAVTLAAYDAAGNAVRRTTVGADDLAFDSDADGLEDLGEWRYFGDLDETGAGDADADGLVNSNELAFGSHPLLKNTDGDPHDDYEEWVADTAPANAASYFAVTGISCLPFARVGFLSSPRRVYTLYRSTNLVTAAWTEVPGQERVPGRGGVDALQDERPAGAASFRVGVTLP